MKRRDLLERIYSSGRFEDIPWVRETPPLALVELINDPNRAPAGTALDLGCGTGHYAIWLARRGFRVTAVDVSPSAIREAQRNAEKEGVDLRFQAADVLGDLSPLGGDFDFTYDWHLLHHIDPEERPVYAANVQNLLKPGGRHLSVCFSEQDTYFGGKGKYRTTPLGTTLYFSSEREIRDLFTPHFRIEELKTIDTEGKASPHRSVWAFMTKP